MMTTPRIKLPTAVAKDLEIEIDGEPRLLRLRFRAWEKLGVEPLNPQSLHDFFDNMTSAKALAILEAGLAHEYLPNGPRAGQQPITAEELKDLVDVPLFVGAIEEILRTFAAHKAEGPRALPEAVSETPAGGAAPAPAVNGHDPDPPSAWTGSQSGPSPSTTSD